MPGPFDQHRYQVRLDWGTDGARRLAPADVTVVVDVLRFSTTVTGRIEAGGEVALGAIDSLNGAAVAAVADSPLVLLGCLRNASAVAAAIGAEQERRAARTSVNVIAAGELTGPEDGDRVRFAVEDLLGAGAVIDALAARGIDHSSPDAAAAGEAFAALRRAPIHLLTASGSGQELIGRGQGDEVRAAAAVDASASVPVRRGDRFVAHR